MSTEQEKQKVYSYLQTQSIMFLGTSSKEGIPHVSPLLFAVDKKLNFYFITRPDSKKGQLLEINPVASLAIGKKVPIGIQAFGSVEKITDLDEQEKILDMIIESADRKSNFWPPLFHIKKGDSAFMTYKITTKSLRSLDLSIGTISTNKELFTQIIG